MSLLHGTYVILDSPRCHPAPPAPQLWGCVTLFMFGNLLKTLFAKLLSSKFNKHSHLQKMHDSLRKVGCRYLPK